MKADEEDEWLEEVPRSILEENQRTNSHIPAAQNSSSMLQLSNQLRGHSSRVSKVSLLWWTILLMIVVLLFAVLQLRPTIVCPKGFKFEDCDNKVTSSSFEGCMNERAILELDKKNLEQKLEELQKEIDRLSKTTIDGHGLLGTCEKKMETSEGDRKSCENEVPAKSSTAVGCSTKPECPKVPDEPQPPVDIPEHSVTRSMNWTHTIITSVASFVFGRFTPWFGEWCNERFQQLDSFVQTLILFTSFFFPPLCSISLAAVRYLLHPWCEVVVGVYFLLWPMCWFDLAWLCYMVSVWPPSTNSDIRFCFSFYTIILVSIFVLAL